MSEDKNKSNNLPKQQDKVIQINEGKNYSEKTGDLINKSERGDGQFAKPFINQVIQPTTTPTPTNDTQNTSDNGSE